VLHGEEDIFGIPTLWIAIKANFLLSNRHIEWLLIRVQVCLKRATLWLLKTRAKAYPPAFEKTLISRVFDIIRANMQAILTELQPSTFG